MQSANSKIKSKIYTAEDAKMLKVSFAFCENYFYLGQYSDKNATVTGIEEADQKTYRKALDILQKGNFVFANNKTKREQYNTNKKLTGSYFNIIRNIFSYYERRDSYAHISNYKQIAIPDISGRSI